MRGRTLKGEHKSNQISPHILKSVNCLKALCLGCWSMSKIIEFESNLTKMWPKPSRHPFQAPNRHIQTPSRRSPDTLQTLSRHHQDRNQVSSRDYRVFEKIVPNHVLFISQLPKHLEKWKVVMLLLLCKFFNTPSVGIKNGKLMKKI